MYLTPLNLLVYMCVSDLSKFVGIYINMGYFETLMDFHIFQLFMFNLLLILLRKI
jgi:hypothetical protein